MARLWMLYFVVTKVLFQSKNYYKIFIKLPKHYLPLVLIIWFVIIIPCDVSIPITFEPSVLYSIFCTLHCSKTFAPLDTASFTKVVQSCDGSTTPSSKNFESFDQHFFCQKYVFQDSEQNIDRRTD